jgi:hypothetical protein
MFLKLKSSAIVVILAGLVTERFSTVSSSKAKLWWLELETFVVGNTTRGRKSTESRKFRP